MFDVYDPLQVRSINFSLTNQIAFSHEKYLRRRDTQESCKRFRCLEKPCKNAVFLSVP